MGTGEELIEKANRCSDRGDYKPALKFAFEALELADKKNDDVLHSQALGTAGNILYRAGKFNEALSAYLSALKIQERLAEENPFFKSDVAMTLNNLGALLSDLGRFDDAKDRYERSLKMREALLDSDPENTAYKSDVAMTLNNLGALLSDLGRFDDAKDRYERSLTMREVLLESYPANTIFRSRAAGTTLRYWETVIEVLDSKKIRDSLAEYRNASQRLAEEAGHFKELGLIYESTLLKKLGIVSELKYNARTIRLETTPKKRISGYNKCAEIASSLSEIESENEQSEKWSDMAQYYRGRALANESMINGFNRGKLENAIETFKNASKTCDEAYPCYCIYDTLLQLAELSKNKIDIPEFKRRLRKTREKMQVETAASKCLLKIEGTLEQGEEKADRNEILRELNNEIITIEHHALRGLFKHVSDELSEYFKNPMEIDVHFQNWSLTVEISKIEGIVKIRTEDAVLCEANVGRKKRFLIPFEPQNPIENICFESKEKPYMRREIPVKCCELIGGQTVYFLKRRVM